MFIVPPLKPANEIIGGCIAIWNNAWTDTDKIIKELETSIKTTEGIQWTKATTFAELDGLESNVQRTNSNFFLNDGAKQNEYIRQTNNNFFELTASCAQWYTEHFGIEEQIQFKEGFNLLRYQTGQEYHAHYDGGTSTGRTISPILYLNDDYTGGEIEFVNQKIKYKPKAGDYLIFPANFAFRHIAHPVKTGTKYAIVTWLHDQ